MLLSDIAIRKAKAGDKPLRDGGGLYLLIQPSGARWWRLDYRITGRRKTLSLGVYPAVGLKDARKRRDEAKELIARGIDPSDARKHARASQAHTFASLAADWMLRLKKEGRAASTIAKAQWILDDYILPHIGSKPITSVTAPDLLRLLRAIESKNLNETAHRAKRLCSQIFRYAVGEGLAETDPTATLRGQLVAVKPVSHAALTDPNKIRGLLLAIDGYDGEPVTAAALKLAPLVFVRPGELRGAEWSEFDLDSDEPTWRIPAARMKMKIEHIVPLAPQVVAIIRDLAENPLARSSKFVFPSAVTSQRSMSENTVNAGLRRLGYTGDEMVGHGFRAMASTRLNELGWASDLIERQLAHVESNKVRAAYNRAQYLEERRKMMCAWADYLDGLKIANNVTPIRKRA